MTIYWKKSGSFLDGMAHVSRGKRWLLVCMTVAIVMTLAQTALAQGFPDTSCKASKGPPDDDLGTPPCRGWEGLPKVKVKRARLLITAGRGGADSSGCFE